jgi:hypothetical protein
MADNASAYLKNNWPTFESIGVTVAASGVRALN